MFDAQECVELFDLESRLEILQENIEAMEKTMVRKKEEVLGLFKEEIKNSIEEIREKVKENERLCNAQIENLSKLLGEVSVTMASLQRQIEYLSKKKWYQFNG
jgi:flagellar hook-basal body complex protein FliE